MNLNELILINIIRIVLFINNIINKISLIYETEKELKQLKTKTTTYKFMLKFAKEELLNERNRRIESDNKVLHLRQLYLKKLLEK
jgi:hypothetical protein